MGLLALFYLLGMGLGGYLPAFARWVDELGAWGPTVFILGYSAAVMAMVPAVIPTFAGGAIFGIVEGTVYCFVAATIGSCAAFLVARHLARDTVARRIERDERFAAVDRAVGDRGRRIVLLLRLSPIFPFNLLNYGLGLTRIRFGDYLMASIAMLPGTLLYVYYGRLAGDVAALASGAVVAKGGAYYALLVLGLVATLAVTVYVARSARRAVDEAIER